MTSLGLNFRFSEVRCSSHQILGRLLTLPKESLSDSALEGRRVPSLGHCSLVLKGEGPAVNSQTSAILTHPKHSQSSTNNILRNFSPQNFAFQYRNSPLLFCWISKKPQVQIGWRICCLLTDFHLLTLCPSEELLGGRLPPSYCQKQRKKCLCDSREQPSSKDSF